MSAQLNIELGGTTAMFVVKSHPLRGKYLLAGDAFLLGAGGPLVEVGAEPAGRNRYGQIVLHDTDGEFVTVDPEQVYQVTQAYRIVRLPCMVCGNEIEATVNLPEHGMPTRGVCGGHGRVGTTPMLMSDFY